MYPHPVSLAISDSVCLRRPARAMPKVLDQAGLTLKDVDVFEFHEAFAVRSCPLIHTACWCVERFVSLILLVLIPGSDFGQPEGS